MLTVLGYQDFIRCNPGGGGDSRRLTRGEKAMTFTKPNEYAEGDLSVIQSLDIWREALVSYQQSQLAFQQVYSASAALRGKAEALWESYNVDDLILTRDVCSKRLKKAEIGVLNASVNSFGDALLVLRFVRNVACSRDDRCEFSNTLRNVENFICHHV